MRNNNNNNNNFYNVLKTSRGVIVRVRVYVHRVSRNIRAEISLDKFSLVKLKDEKRASS